MFKSKSVWSQFGKAPKSRDADGASASGLVSEDVQAGAVDKPARLVEFSELKRDRLPPRPSTSAGPESAFAKRKNAEKRETKDDLHFNPLAAHGKGTTFYNFPLPGNLPTPASSPTKSVAPPMPRKSSMKRPVQRPATPDSMEIVPDVPPAPEPIIGMALGSPSHPPTVFQQSPSDISPMYSGRDNSIDDRATPTPPLRHKQSKWKIFGGLFGAKKNDASDFYQVKPESLRTTPRSEPEPFIIESPSELETQRPKSRGRGRAKSVSKSHKDKSDIKRTNTGPPRFDMSGAQNQAPLPDITLEGKKLEEKTGTSLLDVEIPTTKMDRYSVMFSSVLQTPSQSTASSLLARRQATLEKLKTVNEALASKEKELNARERQIMTRPVSSPQPTKSPAFSLFPKEQTGSRPNSLSQPHSTLGLQRSNTSPAALSPSRPTFAPGPQNAVHAALLEEDPPQGDLWVDKKGIIRRGLPLSVNTQQEAKPLPQPTAANPRNSVGWSPEQSHLSLESPEIIEDTNRGHLPRVDECEKEDTYDPAPLPMKPILTEPTWQMVKQPQNHTANSSISTSSTNSGSTHSTSTSASSITTPQSANSLTGKQLKEIRLRSPPQNPPAPAASHIPKPGSRPRAATATASTSSSTTHTASLLPRRKASIITHSNGRFTASPSPGPRSPEEVEAHLKSAADLSIARQISISQQQRQLLKPLTTSSKMSGNSTVGGVNFPTPASGIVGKVASPLSAVASAAQERAASPAQRRSPSREAKREKEQVQERVVQGVKPSTPTLVVVDANENETRENDLWNGVRAKAPLSLAERRRQKEKAHDHAGERGSGEILIGHAISGPGEMGREKERLLRARELQHRKSERVVVERVSVDSERG